MGVGCARVYDARRSGNGAVPSSFTQVPARNACKAESGCSRQPVEASDPDILSSKTNGNGV
jgi:hypothetical protein